MVRLLSFVRYREIKQLLNLRGKICSEDRQFQERVSEFAGWFKDRGYKELLVSKLVDRVRRLDRTTLLANAGHRTNTTWK